MQQSTELIFIFLLFSSFLFTCQKSNINEITSLEEINVSNSIFKSSTITMLDDQSNSFLKITGKQLTLQPDLEILKSNL